MKKIFLFITLFILCFITHSQAQTYTWEKIYNGSGTQNDYAKCNSEIYNDSYYYVGGRTGLVCYILKINCKTGAKIWEKTIGQSSEQGIVDAIILTEDGGCIFSGSRGNAFSVKLDSLGEVVWNRFYDINNSYIKKIIRLSDGNYLMCGQTFIEEGLIVKIDANGNFIWTRTYNFLDRTRYSSVIEINQRYYLTGTTRADTSKVIFTTIDSAGNLINNKIYNFFEMSCIGGNITKQSENIVLTGASGGAFYLVKINLNGDTLYQKRISYIRYDGYIHSKYINNNFYFSSILISNNNDSLYGKILITDTLGNEIRHQLFRKYDLEIRDFTSSTKNNLILTGTVSNTGAAGDDDYYLLRVDSTLNVSVKTNSVLVKDFLLHQNYPNPFNPYTRISYSLKKSSNIELKLFDINGRIVKIIESGFKPVGSYEINFSADGLSSGVYYFSLFSEGILMDTKKAVLLK